MPVINKVQGREGRWVRENARTEEFKSFLQGNKIYVLVYALEHNSYLFSENAFPPLFSKS